MAAESTPEIRVDSHVVVDDLIAHSTRIDNPCLEGHFRARSERRGDYAFASRLPLDPSGDLHGF